METKKLKSGKGCFLVGLPIISLFCGFMMATAGLAVFPSLCKISEPVLGQIEITSRTFSNPYEPGYNRTTTRSYYINGEKSGLKVMFVSFLLYSIIFYGLFAIIVFLKKMFRGNS